MAQVTISRTETPQVSEQHVLSRFRELPGLLFLLASALMLWVLQPNFANPTNLMTIARDTAIVGIMGAGMTLVIITSGIDLSVASVLAFSAAVMGKTMMSGSSIGLAILAALGVGAVFGMLNAFLITRFAIPPIITTLGTMGIVRAGVTLYAPRWIGPLPQDFGFVGIGWTPVALLAIAGTAASLFLLKTRPGRHVLAVGGNEEASRLSGVNVSRTLGLVYTLNGILAAVAGVIMASSMSSAQSNMAMGYELNVIAAVVIGGTSISGGQGSILGTIIGAAIMAVLSNALILLGAPIYWHKVITGAIILIAVLMDRLRYLVSNESHSKV